MDICFLIDKVDVFINKNTDVQLAQYTASRQKEIIGLYEKSDFKVTFIYDIPSNVQIFNSRFIDEIKNPSTNKVYDKIWLII